MANQTVGESPRQAEPIAAFLLDAAAPLFLGLGLSLWALFTYTFARGRSDFLRDYVAAYALRHHLPLYGDAEELTRLFGVSGAVNFHPPTNAILFVPITVLPYGAAFAALNIAGLIALGFLLKGIFEEALIPTRLARFLGAAVLLWQPFVANTALGQVSLFTALGVLWTWRFLARDQQVRAGIVLGVLALIKLFPLLFIVFLAVTRRWRAAVALVAVVAIGFAVTALIVGGATMVFYAQSVIPENLRGWGGFPLNASVQAVFAMLSRHQPDFWAAPAMSEAAGGRLGLATCAIVVAVTAVLAAAGRRIGARADLYAYHTTTAAMLIVSPLTWSHAFLALLWPGATLLQDAASLTKAVRVLAVIAFVTFSLPGTTIAQRIIDWYSPRQVPWFAALPCMLPAFGLIVLWVICCSRVKTAEAQ